MERKKVYKQQNASWRVRSGDKTARSQSLDGEATECRLCKHCGCMLNSEY